jgi:hypothetical protein
MGFSTTLSKFSFELKHVPEELKSLLEKSFKMKMLKNELKDGEDTLLFEIRFNPLKPFKTIFDLIIMRDIGGIWK